MTDRNGELYSKVFPKKRGMTPVQVTLRRADSGYPWVTHLRDASLARGGHYWGHYFQETDYGKAVSDFRSRVREEFKACVRAGLLSERQEAEYTDIFETTA